MGANRMYISPLLDELKLEAQAFFFKVTMLANSIVAMKPHLDCNPCFSRCMDSNLSIDDYLSNYLF
jgi:hypothetical protein